jgi:hypothetical protein
MIKEFMIRSILLILFNSILLMSGYAQVRQTIRGQITDQLLQHPIEGATVTIVGQNRSTITDSEGYFRFAEVPIGVHQIRITHTGFKPVLLERVVLNAGKELILNPSMEPEIQTQETVVVKAKAIRSKPMNDLSVVSARAFSVEETQRYAAAVNDPLRMATSFAGVITANDGGNHIVIRGNAPNTLLWRMEGIDIPNPNHFASASSSGGGISSLSAQVLSNSDFVTGAFAAEYGNAVGGVFDLRLRKGNNEKREHTIEAGVLGLNIATEGPFSKNYKGSYLVNYRYSTLGLLSKIGINPAGESTTNFSDLSYNISLPAKGFGSFTLFGMNGWSDQHFPSEKDPAKWEEEWSRYGGEYRGRTTINGITHSIGLSPRTRLITVLSHSTLNNRFNEMYTARPDSVVNSFREIFDTRKWILSSTLNTQFSKQHALRAGIIVSQIDFNYLQKSRENTHAPAEERINVKDQTQQLQAFAQWQYKPTDQLMITGGLHYMQFMLNNSNSIEPRAAILWTPHAKNSFGLGYGLHSQTQILGVYFARTRIDGEWIQPNKKLDLTRSHHFVGSYTRQLAKGLKLRAELYYQHLFDVPISIYDTSTISALNIGESYLVDPLVNKGKGRNYGLELSLEKQLRNDFYFLFSNSLYESKYTAADGKERDTRYNGNYSSTLTAGKEFIKLSSNRSFAVNFKVIYAGGFRQTPLDEQATLEQGYAKYRDELAYSLKLPAYFRTDLRLSMKLNRTKTTSVISLDFQNLTNRKNVFATYYDSVKGEIRNSYQTGLIPVLAYRLEF